MIAPAVLCTVLLQKTLSLEIEAHELFSIVVARSLFVLVKFKKNTRLYSLMEINIKFTNFRDVRPCRANTGIWLDPIRWYVRVRIPRLTPQKRVLQFKVQCLLHIASALTLKRLMSYIYGAPILDVSRSHTTTQHSR